MKKVMLLVASEKGYSVLNALKDQYKDYIGLVASYNEVGVEKDWYADIHDLCGVERIPFLSWRDLKDNIPENIVKYGITGMICISWRFLIDTSINEYLEDNIIIFHDSLLPKYRGFSPIPTAMICGEKEVGATALFAADLVDAGDVLYQTRLTIEDDDYVEDVIRHISDLYVNMSKIIIEDMLKGRLQGTPQKESEATYSIWRGDDDYWIDWSRSADEIRRFIKAVGYPYKGALTMLEDKMIRIRKAKVLDRDYSFAIRQPGKIWSSESGCPIVVCGEGMLVIEDAYNTDGASVTFPKLRVKLTGK